MTLKGIINALNIDYKLENKNINHIRTDSRIIKRNDIFIALKGINYDGHDYVEEAINKGALICITERYINEKCIVVKDTYEALYKIGNYYRKKFNIPLIAITGSTGKTTTKELISLILSSKYNVLYNKGSKNNLIGISDTLFNLNDKYDLIVMELGSNHLGEISYLSKMCIPTYSLITNIGTSHIGNFKSKKNIFLEKKSILDGMQEKNLITNGDDKYLKKLKGFKCGTSNDNDLIAYNVRTINNKLYFDINLDSKYSVEFNISSRYFINEILMAIKVGLLFDVDINTIIDCIYKFEMPNKRMNFINLKNNNILISDCYNASYESILLSIDYLKTIKNKKIIILGDILELGKESRHIHQKINKSLKKIKNKLIITIGNYTKYINSIHFKDMDTLLLYLSSLDIKDCYIYLKGSRKMNLDVINDYLLNM